ncbi:MAG: hypothetical protein AAB403_23665 [Planctomycetota bacterium]
MTALGDVFAFHYDSTNMLTNVTDVAAARSAAFNYTTNGLVSQITDSGNQSFQFGYESTCHRALHNQPVVGGLKPATLCW